MRRLPLADGAALRPPARRTRLLGIALAALLAAIVLFLAYAVRGRVPGANALPPGASAVVVLDLSGSTRSYPAPIENTLLALTKDGRRHLGLVLFSDSAYEALPPGTPVEGLRGWLDVFQHSQDEHYPWTSFSGGTAISTGLVAARKAILRDHVPHPHVLLVSDLIDDETDLGRLAFVVSEYAQDKIDLRVVSVTGLDSDLSALASLQVHNAAFVAAAASARIDPRTAPPARASLRLLALVVGALALLAAAFELGFHPLAWKGAAA
jgi:hypothetical protein